MKRVFFLIFTIAVVGTACSPARKLAENEVLLLKTSIKSDQSKYNDNLNAIIKQKPNRKMLGLLRFNLGMYNTFSGGKSKVSNWLATTVGEEPSILDTTLTKRTSTQLELFMRNRGFFHAKVKDTTCYYGRKENKAKVVYNVTSGTPYSINQLNYSIVDTAIAKLIEEDKKNSLIKVNDNFDTKILQDERERISIFLKNKGYYFFNQQYVSYRVDSSLKSNQVKLFLDIAPETVLDTASNAGMVVPHTPYVVNNVYIRTDYDPLREFIPFAKDTFEFNNYTFLSSSGIKQYNYCILTQHIFLSKGKQFKLTDLERSYERLADLGVFKFVNIELVRDSSGSLYNNLLDAFVYLTPRQKQDYSIEIEGTRSGADFGIAGNLVYRNKNTFSGAEILQIKLGGSVEATRNLSDDQTDNRVFIFNTYEIGPEFSISIPKLVLPFVGCRNVKNANAFTTFSTNYNLQNRPEFRRAIFNISTGYGFKLNRFVQWRIFPAEVSFVDVSNLSDEFEQSLINTGSQAVVDQFANHLIPNGRFSFIYNDQKFGKSKNFTFFRLDFETAGNLLYYLDKNGNKSPNSNGRFEILGIPYSQYVKPELDLRYYQYLNQKNTLVYRLNGGIGIPYKNSDLLPYEETFWGGGPNDLRAFRSRKLGPGGFKEDDKVERNGEIKINANFEYRFDIIKYFKGAAFVDAGNIWLRKEDINKPDAHFELKRFVDEIAIGTGLGLRWDFQFFIIRLDGGIKIKDPENPKGNRWVIDQTQFKDINLNLGIGYPF